MHASFDHNSVRERGRAASHGLTHFIENMCLRNRGDFVRLWRCEAVLGDV